MTRLLGGPFRESLAFVQLGVLACRATRALAAMIAIGPVFERAISRVSCSTTLETTEFALVALLQIVAQLALCASPDLLLLLLHESHGLGGKYIPIMVRLAKARRWSKR